MTEATRTGGAVGLPAEVLATGEPAWVTDLARDTSFLDGTLAGELDIRASFAFPVLIEREVVAVLEFFADRPADPDPSMLEVMADVGAQLGRVVERKRAAEALRSEEIARRALHDSLTGLPNMTLFTDHLSMALSRLSRHPGTVGVLFVDLDRFKAVNDTYGHAAGSALLIQVVRRLEQMVRPTDTIARFGGDEFVVLCEDLPGKQEALRIAERITGALAEPFDVDGRRISISGSVGLAMSHEPGRDPEELIQDADTAMYRAKRHGRARYELFDGRMRSQARGRRRVETALREALERDELRLYLQPVVRLEDEAAVGAEALVRWRHPTRGLLAPPQFLLVAEESGLIVQIDRWMLQHAAAWLRSAGNAEGGGEPIWVSLNLSARQFERADLAEVTAKTIRSAGIDPASICLEVSESALVEDPEGADGRLRALKEVGVRLAVDGFGTGFASPGFVNRFPIDMLKLARPLIAGLGSSGRQTAIVDGIVRMAGALGLQTVGEGVETEEQAAASGRSAARWPRATDGAARSRRSRSPASWSAGVSGRTAARTPGRTRSHRRQQPPSGVHFAAMRREDRVERDFWWRTGLYTVGTVARACFDVHFAGTHNIPRKGPAILASNHISVIDPVIIALAPSYRGRTVRFLAAAEMFEKPLIGTGLRLIKQIPIRRGERDFKALEEAAGVIATGALAGIFPEGGVGPGPLQPGRRGAARIALSGGVPLIPVAVWGTHRRWPQFGFRVAPPWRPRVAAVFGPPITPVGSARNPHDVHELNDRIMREIAQALDRAKRIAGP
ncbi:MAG: EAL domain-containing protein [Actinomycetota bacterium]|nr:EAL domain-containing protein [Actinomycetota bacterium]